MIVLDVYSCETEERRISFYIRGSDIIAMTGPYKFCNISVRDLYVEGIPTNILLLDNMDNYDKVVKVLEGK